VKVSDRLAAAAWLLVAGAAGALSLGWVRLSALEAVPLCAFRWLTSVPCPGCGMCHSLLAAFQGHWGEAFRCHPLGIPFAAVWTFWLAHGLWNRRIGRGFSEGFPLDLRGWKGPAAIALVLAVYGLRAAGVRL